MPTVADYARDYLIAEGLVRKPRVVGASTIYPMWINPREGAPPPRNPEVEPAATTESNDDLVISAFSVTSIPRERHSEWALTPTVELWFRGRTYPLIEAFWLLVRPKFVDKVAGSAKRNWSMAGLTVLESLWPIELQRIGSDDDGWTYRAELSLEIFQP